MGSVSTEDGSTPARRRVKSGSSATPSSPAPRTAGRKATSRGNADSAAARRAKPKAAPAEDNAKPAKRKTAASSALRTTAKKPAAPPAVSKAAVRPRRTTTESGEEFRSVPSAPPAVTSAPTAVESLPDDRYFNRELSWLDFNARVLALAEDESQPLLERAKFLAIFASNLDEFYMVRVAGLKRRDGTGLSVRSADGLTPREQLDYIAKRNQDLVERHTAAFKEHLRPQLAEQDIRIVGWADLSGADQLRLSSYFSEQIFPVLTPLAVDPAHPFPYISGLSLNLAVTVRDPQGGLERFARVKVPSNVPRLMRVETERGNRSATFLPLEELISAHLSDLFTGMEVTEHHVFRVTRNADFEVEEDRDEDLLQALERELAQRRFGPPVRLEVAQDMSEHMLELLLRELEVDPEDVVEVPGLLDLTCLFQLSAVDRKELKDRPFVPATHPAFGERETPKSVFATLREGDVLVHHPYDSFSTSVQRFIEQAAADSKVLAIKQTLYRTSGDSPIVDALIDAAEAGKQVVALVEIKARFDEQANITWARTLERAGVHVVYGLVGLKTHCKVSMVVRQEGSTIRRYCHIGTGNYNPKTARLYEDLGLLTADPSIGADITDLFNVLTGYSRQDTYRTILTSPHGIRRGIVRAIGEEIELARAGLDAGIRIKCNSLVDEQVIDALYHASQAGVPVDVVVRGICSLKPGVEGLSENIRVRSILGRFLEHSRVFNFRAGGTHWIGSADMMHRNLDRRIEALVRVKDPRLTRQLDEVFDSALDPHTRCWVLSSSGEWQPFPAAGSQVRDHQLELAKLHGAVG
ncbi:MULTISPECIES: RNA degradosome polyphosphate kinase [Amycolatopsis]|uniref:Polyphosphate kinase n=1 Tax=Amycolatopsis dendrobii TaxID=2760662 RepID=A0A7W3ZBS7_9PSEU|nr:MULTISPECIES: RNA degradosome polyphosphate kinase [Amycolatopsis]MBB1155143.1 RNA degradosome polyphosphate kinase [Amycolatopsis dendrobii]UKD54907.1 RNA degradosome polyphosphate kinase [Amycolatopsis sp. FU40]